MLSISIYTIIIREITFNFGSTKYLEGNIFVKYVCDERLMIKWILKISVGAHLISDIFWQLALPENAELYL